MGTTLEYVDTFHAFCAMLPLYTCFFPCAMSLNCRLSVTNLPQLLLKYHDTRGNSECTILYHSSHVASATAPLMIYLEESLHSDSWRLSRGVTG